MHPDPASLSNLRDIVTPPSVPWWPPAPGWWLLSMVLGLIAVLALVHGWRRWRANAYRRVALRALRDAANSASIAEILKRVALVAYPRTQVASLTGSAWVTWLAATGARPVPAEASRALAVGVFAERECGDVSQLAAFAAQWIQCHKQGAGPC